MDAESAAAVEMIDILGLVDQVLRDSAVYADRLIGVREVYVDVEFSGGGHYHTSISAYVDVKLTSDNHVTWHLHLDREQDFWMVRQYTARNDDQGEVTLFEFDDRVAHSVRELREAVQAAVTEMTESVRACDFLALSQRPKETWDFVRD